MKFIGRKSELEALEKEWSREGGAFVPIYGRRRVGKSELILRFLEGRRGIYYLGKRAPAALQIRELLEEASIAVDEPLLAEIETRDWKRALTAIVERHRGPEKLVLVLDEFQWIAGVSPELPSILQELWDRSWKRSGRVMLILCGSYVGFMEREVLGRKSPLFGRRTAQIQLQPFGYEEAAEFHPSWSIEERARAYFVCGGVPLYLELFGRGRSVEQNIVTTLLDEHAPLFREPDFLLREELRDVENYYAVLLAIARGRSTNREIAKETGLPERSLHYYVQQLSALGYVSRRHPLTGGRPNARKVRYVLLDPLLRFWFHFVYPNQSYIAHRGGARAFRDRIKAELPAYFGACFESLCRQALPRIYAREGVTSAFEIGEYWSKDVQIDVVGVRDDAWTDLGECKWGPVRSTAALRRELDAKVPAFPNARNATIGRRLFVRKRPKRGFPDDGASWYALEDLYG